MTTETEQTAETLAEQPVSLDEVSTETKVEETTKPEGEEASEAGETAGEEQPKKLSGAQRAKIREQRLLAELNEAQRKLEEATRQAPAKAGETTEKKPPREEDYNGDWFAWQRAMTAFEAGEAVTKAINDRDRSREQSERQTKQAEIARERQVAHLERVEDARDVIADFDQVMKAMDGVNVRQDVIDEIMSSDKSALLAYHLAKNPDKLIAMDRMSARELAREMGRLEASIRMPAAKKQTTAPTPLEPLKGGASGSFDPEKASMDDYVAKRKAGWKG